MDDQLLAAKLRRISADVDVASTRQHRPAVFARLDRRRRRRRIALSSASVALVLCAVIVVARGSSSQSTEEVSTATSQSRQVTAAQLASGKWRTVPAPPIVVGENPAVLWTGSRLLVWGGQLTGDVVAPGAGLSRRAALFDPTSGKWKITAPAPLSPGTPIVSAWTGKEVILWTGYKEPKPTCDSKTHQCHGPATMSLAYGASYNPKTNRWRRLRETGAPELAVPPLFGGPNDEVADPVGVWTGEALVVLSPAPPPAADLPSASTTVRPTHRAIQSEMVDANEFDPATGRWRPLLSLSSQMRSRTLERIDAVQVGGTIDVWLSWSGALVPGGGSGVGIQQMFQLHGSRWSKANVADPGVVIWQPVASGRSVTAFGAPLDSLCFECNQLAQTDLPTVVLRATAGRSGWRTVSSGPVPAGGQQVAAGNLVVRLNTSITIGSKTGSGYALQPGDAAVLDPGSGRWTHLPSAPIDGGGLQLLWTGDRLIGFEQLTRPCPREKTCRGGQLLMSGIELVPGRG